MRVNWAYQSQNREELKNHFQARSILISSIAFRHSLLSFHGADHLPISPQPTLNVVYKFFIEPHPPTPAQIFVGDLGNTVTDSMLMQSFTQVSLTPSDARVMWDNSTGRSRGYGFVSFRTHEEATKAIEAMNGQFIGSRRVRCGWAQHKQEPTQLSYDAVNQQDPQNVNVYVGNISADVSDTELRRQFLKFGPIVEVKIQVGAAAAVDLSQRFSCPFSS